MSMDETLRDRALVDRREAIDRLERLRKAAQVVVTAAGALNIPLDWAADNRERVIVPATALDNLLDAVDALAKETTS